MNLPQLFSQISHRLHRLMHLLNLNLSKRILVGQGMPNLYDLQEECLTCKERKRLNTLAVTGPGTVTFFQRNGPEEGWTYDTPEEVGKERPRFSRGPY